jgi:hypothetical protein
MDRATRPVQPLDGIEKPLLLREREFARKHKAAAAMSGNGMVPIFSGSKPSVRHEKRFDLSQTIYHPG